MKIIKTANEYKINYGALWDGVSEKLSAAGTLTVIQSVIAEPNKESNLQLLDFSHLTLMPALIDCHTHLALPYDTSETIDTRASALLNCGIVAVRDGGSRFRLPAIHSPLIISHCHHAITKTGYYGQNLGKAVKNIAEATALINQLASFGAGHIKIIASDIFSFSNFSETGPLPFNKNELKKLTQHAHSLGLTVMAHASGDEAVQNCIFANVDSVEHGYFMTEESLATLAKKDIAWIPTLTPVAAQLDNPHLCHALTPKQRNVVHRSLQRHKERVGLGATLGIRIGAGTDAGAAGVPHGPSLAKEINQLRLCGLSTISALKAVTSQAATICGFSQLGQITLGKEAFLLAVNGNPLLNSEIVASPAALLLPS
jgi:imidazolonepropionase-like amidohydrolase